jgi:hypothetical protein
MTSAPVCGQCGQSRPAASLDGLCPACLVRISLNHSGDSAESPALEDLFSRPHKAAFRVSATTCSSKRSDVVAWASSIAPANSRSIVSWPLS